MRSYLLCLLLSMSYFIAGCGNLDLNYGSSPDTGADVTGEEESIVVPEKRVARAGCVEVVKLSGSIKQNAETNTAFDWSVRVKNVHTKTITVTMQIDVFAADETGRVITSNGIELIRTTDRTIEVPFGESRAVRGTVNLGVPVERVRLKYQTIKIDGYVFRDFK